MTEKIVGTFEIKHLGVLNEAGEADASLMPGLSDDAIKALFESIIYMRAFNSRALSLQREGRIGTYPSIYGLEATQAATALAIRKSDWVAPTFRENGVFLALGYPAWMLYRYWKGDERGAKTPPDLNILPMSVPVGSHLTHAVGVAYAMKYRKKNDAVICFFGDGASSRGDFHEALNFAGVFKLPVVFVCQNNQWAISVPLKTQTASETIAQRAFGYGFGGIQTDGNDVFAVYKAANEALEKARSGGGPTLIENLTYRLDHHTTADDATRYRNSADVEAWAKKEPLIRLRLFMQKKGLWSETYEKDVEGKCFEKLDAAILEEESYPSSEPDDIIRYTNAEASQRQLRELKERGWLK
ncbi:MAG: pyruvate dehydrogenase (acetyl-transferring) E1 component subunit alpha [Deltaproteobacteria bacterium]|nr:pyruvate dehydrogenase (acetyl-transferring) E1 component subunit alpha [Deltaproteobacteria bacterium]